MAKSDKALITPGTLTEIAAAIRTKTGSNSQYLPGEMAAAIQSIKSCDYHLANNGTMLTVGNLTGVNDSDINQITTIHLRSKWFVEVQT